MTNATQMTFEYNQMVKTWKVLPGGYIDIASIFKITNKHIIIGYQLVFDEKKNKLRYRTMQSEVLPILYGSIVYDHKINRIENEDRIRNKILKDIKKYLDDKRSVRLFKIADNNLLKILDNIS